MGFAERPVRAAAPADGVLVAEWAFLTPPDKELAFADRLDALSAEVEDHGLRYSLCGPWPAYSFAPKLTRRAD
jgi:hypothetical protein